MAKRGRPKGSKTKNEKLSLDRIKELEEANQLLQDEVDMLEDKTEEIAEGVGAIFKRMQDQQERAIGYMFAMNVILAVFAFLGTI